MAINFLWLALAKEVIACLSLRQMIWRPLQSLQNIGVTPGYPKGNPEK